MKWKLVPEIPTPEMIAVYGCLSTPQQKYEAMLAAVDLLKGSIAMIEELEIENAMLRDEVKRLNNVLQR